MSSKSEASRTILIVDDNPTNLHVLFELLNANSFKVAVSESGETALETLELISPDLILLDINMPGIDGYQTCRRIKANPKTKNIPVLFMSALSEPVNKVQGFDVGAVDYITKPFEALETLARIRNHLELKDTRLALNQANETLEARVQARTAELESLNHRLAAEVEGRARQAAALCQSENQFRLMFEKAPIGMAVTDMSGNMIEVNDSLCETLGYSDTELLRRSWHDVPHQDDAQRLKSLYQGFEQGKIDDFQFEGRCLAKDGHIIHGTLQAVKMPGDEERPTYILCQFMDITHRKTVEAELRHRASHDALTQLPNRNLLTQKLDQSLLRIKADPTQKFAVLFLDLNRFKLVNDSLGHQVGDQLLTSIARRLETLVRGDDTIARLGGDEFVILLSRVRSEADAIMVAERIEALLQEPFQVDEHVLFTSVSTGIAMGHPNYNQGVDLLRDADIAMYSAKSRNSKDKETYTLFAEDMYQRVSGQLKLESELHHALERDEFQLYYQPIVSLKNGQINGFEALIRWFKPGQGVVSPADFIPIAEDTGLIVPMGEWILQTAYQQLVQWRQLSPMFESLKVSVNVSTLQLMDPKFLNRLDEILMQSGWNRRGLQIELTESIFMGDVDGIIEVLNQLKARNIELCIDDFGTGYSSLSYLHHFPIDHLKIDRAFVNRIQEAGEQREIAETVITLAHQLGMDTIAEGIELPHQLHQLKSMGCEAAQGYFLAKPLNQEAAEALLLEHSSQTKKVSLF